MVTLNSISDNAGATKPRKRVGRGIGSGKGKTAGRGHKGQKSRSGVAIKGFEGGQQAIYRRLPKRGFTNLFRVTYQALNLCALQRVVDAKRLDASKPVTKDVLVAAGLLRSATDKVKLLAKGELNSALNLEVDAASDSARAAVEKAGGKVAIVSSEPIKKENVSDTKAKATDQDSK